MTNQNEISSESHAQVEFAWRVHSAQEAWTSKVDTKASILLATQVGILIVATTFITSDRAPSFTESGKYTFGIGMFLLSCGIVASLCVIYPQLMKSEAVSEGLIYFGHLRKLEAEHLLTRLKSLNQDVQLRSLASQLVSMSSINWKKHRTLGFSIWLTIAGSLVMSGTCIWVYQIISGTR